VKRVLPSVSGLTLGVLLASVPAVTRAQPAFDILHAFEQTDGAQPGSLLLASDGALYGTTLLGSGPELGDGVLYRIAPDGAFSVVHDADTPDGSNPGRIMQASDGKLYGVTASGGAFSSGTIYRINLDGSGYTVLHSFDSDDDGGGPYALIEASDGFFYGVASYGGTPPPGCNPLFLGTAFRMDTAGNVVRLHTFCREIDGYTPNGIVEAADGFFYGTCANGPLNPGTSQGTLWRMDAAGNVEVLHFFPPRSLNGDEPENPIGLTLGPDGFFYGAAREGGQFVTGALFRADTAGNVETFHSFAVYAPDGRMPTGPLTLGADGAFYGETRHGGLPTDFADDAGVVYRADLEGNVWTLHSFTFDDGAWPQAATPVFDAEAGVVYATAAFSGPDFSNRGVTAALGLEAATPVAALTFAQNPLPPGEATTGTVTLREPAPPGGQEVTLLPMAPLATPNSVTVPAGQTTATVPVAAAPDGNGLAGVTASIGIRGLTAPLRVGAQLVTALLDADLPIVIGPGGGSFAFTVTLTNVTGEPQAVQAWTSVSGRLNVGRVLGPVTVTLPAGATVTRTLTQRVPAAAPPGAYTYHLNVGRFPGEILATDSFPFSKQANGRSGVPGDGALDAGAWPVSGWDDALTVGASSQLPGGFALSEAHPNPFEGRTQLTLEVAEVQSVRVEMFDGLGRRVAVVHDGALEAGAHALLFDGSRLPAGVYVVRVTGETFSATRLVTLVR
jgi:uncharacterized repeat protein (TIGR03803 family)